MAYYKLKVNFVDGYAQYDVPNIDKITVPKYRSDMKECVCNYADELTDTADRIKITETNYNNYGTVSLTVNKRQLQCDGVDTLIVVVNVFEAIVDDEFILKANGDIIDFIVTPNKTETFEIIADETMQGSILELVCSSKYWGSSKPILVEVV